ncbi:hypothetical protein B0T26DRAFT_621645, partial [Lasiosphaeria miniovina]
ASPFGIVNPDWDGLNKSVGGRLYTGAPVGLPCHDNFNSQPHDPDPAACSVVEQHRRDMDWLITQMSGYAQGNWGVCQRPNSGCATSPTGPPINASTPCNQGNIPSYYVDVRQVSDIAAVFAFAAENKKPVVVKNSGHDYKGRSAGLGSLALWMHNYRQPLTLDANFVPDGCVEGVGPGITFGAGEGWDGVFAFAKTHNLTVAGGSSEWVAPGGGWIAGGGHSGLSPRYGLGADNALQLRVVLPNGTYATASHCQNRDLFFALRGGGGGTFGVVTEMTTAAHPGTPVQWASIVFSSLTGPQQRALTAVLVANANAWAAAGWGGYAYPAGARPGGLYPVQLMNPHDLNPSEVKAALAPLLDFAASVNATPVLTSYPNFYDLYLDKIKGSLSMYGNFGLAQASRLVPSTLFAGAENQTLLTDTLIAAMASSPVPTDPKLSMMVLMVAPPPASQLPDSDSAVAPAWRRCTWHVIFSTAWDPADSSLTPAAVATKYRAVTTAMDPLRAITPGGGAYLNEGDTYEPDPVAAFWGRENYARLSRVKGEVDPKGMLQVFGGVGSNADDQRFACYPSL